MALFEKKSGSRTKEKREKTSFGIALANRILVSPRITEKSYLLSEKRQYVFRVALSAKKNEVKQAVEEAYGVRVESVNTSSIPPKRRVFGRIIGKKGRVKKAVVTLSEGDVIPMFQGNVTE